MATITQLYTRLILELDRADDMGSGGTLEQAKIDAVTRAIEHHADELFWFNRLSGTATTVASTATVAVPSGMRLPLQVSYNQSPLTKVQLEDIQHLTATGTPTAWADNEGAIQLSPIPDGAYTLYVFGVEELGLPATTNAWSTTAYDLTIAEAKLRLCRGVLRDPEGAQLAFGEREEALGHLRRETRRRAAVGLTTDLPVPTGFNILTG